MQIIKFIFIIIASVVVAMVVGTLLFALWGNENAFWSALMFGTPLCAMKLGAFNEPKRSATKYDSIKHKGLQKKVA